MSLKRVAVTAAVPAIMASILWVGGYNFDTRGLGPAYALIVTVFASFVVWSIYGDIERL